MSPIGLKQQFEADWITYQREYEVENNKKITLTHDNFHEFCDEWLNDLPICDLDRYIEDQGGIILLLKECDNNFGNVVDMLENYEEWRIKGCILQVRLREIFCEEISIAEDALEEAL